MLAKGEVVALAAITWAWGSTCRDGLEFESGDEAGHQSERRERASKRNATQRASTEGLNGGAGMSGCSRKAPARTATVPDGTQVEGGEGEKKGDDGRRSWPGTPEEK